MKGKNIPSFCHQHLLKLERAVRHFGLVGGGFKYPSLLHLCSVTLERSLTQVIYLTTHKRNLYLLFLLCFGVVHRVCRGSPWTGL